MSFEILSFLLDIVVLVCLGGAIYFGLRMSSALEAFKKSRGEMMGIIETLNDHIMKAEHALKHLKIEGGETADELRGLVKTSRALADELKVMTQSGDRLAQRLERGASEAPVVLSERVAVDDVRPVEKRADPAPFPVDWGGNESGADEEDDGLFLIQDKEFKALLESAEAPAAGTDFESEAERDLYEALHGSTRQSGGKG